MLETARSTNDSDDEHACWRPARKRDRRPKRDPLGFLLPLGQYDIAQRNTCLGGGVRVP